MKDFLFAWWPAWLAVGLGVMTLLALLSPLCIPVRWRKCRHCEKHVDEFGHYGRPSPGDVVEDDLITCPRCQARMLTRAAK